MIFYRFLSHNFCELLLEAAVCVYILLITSIKHASKIMVLAHDVKEGERTRDIQISVDVTFDSMLLSNNTVRGLKNSGFFKPSPIQLHAIPLGKCGFDLFLEAKSGTGKTAVFTVITLEKIALDKGLQSVILAPTREIAAQICDVITQIGSNYEGLNVEVVMGGLPIEQDIDKFRKNVHILVGSPGRMRHLIQDKHIDVSAVRLFILDEADKLMDKNFQADINYIFSALPKQKQVIMSSATYPEALKIIMLNYVQNAQHICPDSTSILLGIKQLVTTVTSNVNIVKQTRNKFGELLNILSKVEFKQCLIFCNYQVRVGELCKMLMQEKWPAEKLHSQLEQNDRLDALKTLQEYKCRILVSTDLAARGIDASNVDLVINFEPPFEWQTYLHRIGRAGRFGSNGTAITILSEGKEQSKFKRMIKNIDSSLNLSYMWSGNMFELDDSDTIPSIVKPIEVTELLDSSEKDETCKTSTVEAVCETLNVADIFKISQVDEKCKVQTLVEPKIEEGCRRPEVVQKLVKNDCKDFVDIPKTKTNTMKNIDVQTFAKILNSFENTKEHKIETFDELIVSFKGHEPCTNEKLEIQHNVTFKKYFDARKYTEPKVILNSNKDTGPELWNRTNESNIGAENITSQYNERIQGDKNLMDKHAEQSDSIHINNDFSLDNLDHIAMLDTSDSQKALRDAGLPISFCSTKHSNKNRVNKSNPRKGNGKVKNKQESQKVMGYKETNNENSYHQKTSKSTYSKKNCKTSPISFDDDGYNTQSCHLIRPSNYEKSQCKQKQDGCSRDEVLYDFSKSSFNTVEDSSDIYHKYMIWFKQFKTHIKHVEMSLYIDEMSNITH